MKYIKQFLIILLISFIGELFNNLVPLPIPGSIYGMIIIFILLCTGIIKLNQIKDVGRFLLSILPMMFIPSAVGIMSQIEQIESIWLEILIVTIVTTFIVMGISGTVTQLVIRLKQRRKDKK